MQSTNQLQVKNEYDKVKPIYIPDVINEHACITAHLYAFLVLISKKKRKSFSWRGTIGSQKTPKLVLKTDNTSHIEYVEVIFSRYHWGIKCFH